MMRLRSPALLRDLLRLSQTGAMTAGGGGLFVCCRRPALRRLHLALPAVAGRPPPLRLLPGARSLCTRSEGILEEPGKGPPQQQQKPTQPPSAEVEAPPSASSNNSHSTSPDKEAGGVAEK